MTQNEIKEFIRKEIKNFIDNDLDVEMKKTLKKQNSQSRNELISTIKNSLEAVYKVLWHKRDFWKTDIK